MILALLIIGIILLVVGWFVPMDARLRTLLKVVGVICLVVGALILILGVVEGTTDIRLESCCTTGTLLP